MSEPKLYIDLDELKARIKALKGHDDCAYDEGWNDAVQAIQIEVIPGIGALPASLLDPGKVLERGGMILDLQRQLAEARAEIERLHGIIDRQFEAMRIAGHKLAK